MLISRLSGGQGNQMFQYALGRALSIKLGVPLGLDTSSFVHDKMRRYSLSLWKGVSAPVVNVTAPVIKEQGLPYNPGLIAKVRDGHMLDGYWQCERYFLEIAKTLREEFVPRVPMTTRGIETLGRIREAGFGATFLTVRRTDYVNSEFHGLLGMDYYLKALELVAQVTDPIVFVFSDEPKWCAANMKLPYPTWIAGNFDRTTRDHLGREDEELTLMKECTHAVCANSSYSWWGAWLRPPSRDRIIVAPKRWFLSTTEDASTICPAEWLRI